MRKSFLTLALYFYIGFAVSLLVQGSKILVYPLSNSPYVPLGNILTWILLAALPLAMLTTGRPVLRDRMMPEKLWNGLRWALIFNLILATLWFPLSRIFAGNWSTTFENQPEVSANWTWFTYAIPTMSLAIGFIILAWSAYARLAPKAE